LQPRDQLAQRCPRDEQWQTPFVNANVRDSTASLAILVLFQPETLKPEELRPFNMAATKSGATRLLTDPLFMGLTFHGGFGMASFFVFIASASFVSA